MVPIFPREQSKQQSGFVWIIGVNRHTGVSPPMTWSYSNYREPENCENAAQAIRPSASASSDSTQASGFSVSKRTTPPSIS